MATKKVKKFGRGGDILTGLGAGLAAFGAYKHFFGDKDKEQTSTGRDVSEPAPQDRGRKGEELLRDAIEGKKNDKTDSGRNSDLSPVEQHAAITRRNSVEPSDNTPVDPNNKKPKKVDDKKKTTTNNVSPNADTSLDKGPKSKPYPLNSVPNENRKSKSYPSSDVTAAKKKEVRDKENEEKDKGYSNQSPTAKAIRRTVRETFPYASDLSDPRGTPSMRARNADPKRAYLHEMAEKGKEKEKERKAKEAREAEERKKRDAAQAKEFRERQLAPLKKGGMVKKYASGGAVKTAKPTMRSASSRADGIAIRGKTRA